MQPCMLLHMTELFEPPVTVGALIRLLPSMDPNVLDELVVRAEGLQTLLALVGLHLAPQTPLEFSRVHLHCVLVHENLEENILKL